MRKVTTKGHIRVLEILSLSFSRMSLIPRCLGYSLERMMPLILEMLGVNLLNRNENSGPPEACTKMFIAVLPQKPQTRKNPNVCQWQNWQVNCISLHDGPLSSNKKG